jgi:hypothetical protein
LIASDLDETKVSIFPLGRVERSIARKRVLREVWQARRESAAPVGPVQRCRVGLPCQGGGLKAY